MALHQAVGSAMDERLKITADEQVVISRSTPELLEVEALYAAGGKPPPAHLHPAQDERFEVLEGCVRLRIAGRSHELYAGEAIDVPRGSVHQVWNPGDEPARVVWQTRPAGRTEEWFRAIDALHRSGRVRRNGMPGPLAFGVLLTEYRDVFRLAARPKPLVRGVLAGLAWLGRLRGYSATPVPRPE